MIIPPGTNVSVPPPPLPMQPPNLSLMRFPLRHLLLKPPPPPHLLPHPRLFNPYVNVADNHTTQDGNAGVENMPRPKIQIPPPPLPLFPIAVRPATTPSFVENPAVVPRIASQDFRIFAEHTIKAALGITPGAAVQVRNY